MIRIIKNLLTKLLSSIIPAKNVNGEKNEAAGVVRRRVEVTVERETVSLRAPVQSAGSADGTTGGGSGLEAPGKRPPPPAQSPVLPALAAEGPDKNQR